jgi:hypothetical protein
VTALEFVMVAVTVPAASKREDESPETVVPVAASEVREPAMEMLVCS